MSFPLFRFTLNNTIAGSKSISEPGGWDEAVLKLQRHEEYHSLIEFYDQPLLFYGANSTEDGGYDYIKLCETQGVNVLITILIEISQNQGVSYSTVFSGLLDITSIKEVDFYKLDCGVIRDDFWQKFINRKSIPVDLSGTTDLDGNVITAESPITLSLTSQKIRQLLTSSINVAFTFTSTGTETIYLLDPDTVIMDEIKDRIPLGTVLQDGSDSVITPIWYNFEYDGSYTFDIRVEASTFSGGVGSAPIGGDWAIIVYRKDGTGTGSGFFTKANFTTGLHTSTVYTLSTTLSLNQGDQIYISGRLDPIAAGDVILIYGIPGSSSPGPPSGIVTVATYFNISADTTYPNTSCDVFPIYYAGRSIVEKLTGIYNCYTSSFFVSGCGKYHHLTGGINVRGYSMTEKPFSMSWDDFWAGANPIFNLGLGYSGSTIVVEPKSSFYDATPSLNLDYVNFIERSYEVKKIFKSVQIGFQKWSAESASGVDDPQTSHTYTTKLKTVGEDIKLLSKFYAASLGIEQTRRNKKYISKDWRLDQDIFIIAFNKADQGFPELDENFLSVSNLDNSDARYNIRLVPSRMLIAWRNYLNGGLQGVGGSYMFQKGEGNTDMISELNHGDCQYTADDPLGEKLNISITNSFLFIPTVYEFEHPLTYAQYSAIVANRTKAIGVSRTASGHVPCHILNLEYHVTHGKAKFTVILGQLTPIA